MAYIGKEDFPPIWLPEPPSGEILANSFVELPGIESDDKEPAHTEESSFGFIVRDWFGPFLMGPPTRFLRGRC